MYPRSMAKRPVIIKPSTTSLISARKRNHEEMSEDESDYSDSLSSIMGLTTNNIDQKKQKQEPNALDLQQLDPQFHDKVASKYHDLRQGRIQPKSDIMTDAATRVIFDQAMDPKKVMEGLPTRGDIQHRMATKYLSKSVLEHRAKEAKLGKDCGSRNKNIYCIVEGNKEIIIDLKKRAQSYIIKESEKKNGKPKVVEFINHNKKIHEYEGIKGIVFILRMNHFGLKGEDEKKVLSDIIGNYNYLKIPTKTKYDIIVHGQAKIQEFWQTLFFQNLDGIKQFLELDIIKESLKIAPAKWAVQDILRRIFATIMIIKENLDGALKYKKSKFNSMASRPLSLQQSPTNRIVNQCRNINVGSMITVDDEDDDDDDDLMCDL